MTESHLTPEQAAFVEHLRQGEEMLVDLDLGSEEKQFHDEFHCLADRIRNIAGTRAMKKENG